jgi:hypothetical protein
MPRKKRELAIKETKQQNIISKGMEKVQICKEKKSAAN